MPTRLTDIAARYLNNQLNAAKHDREHQKVFAMPTYASAAPRVMEREPEKDIFLGRYMVMGMRQKSKKKNWRFNPQFQRHGSCVGQGAAMACNVVMGIDAFLEGTVFAGRASAGAIYAGSRVEIGRKPGSWEGSVGSWAAEWVTRGVVLMNDMGLDDEIDDPDQWLKIVGQDEKLGMQWTRQNSGVPSELEQQGGKRVIQSTPLITTIAEARAAISNLTPIVLCGGVHPSKNRNANGASVSLERGGGHCTAIIGMRFDGREWWYDHLQSWWHYYTGGYARSKNPIDAMFSTSVTQVKESWLTRWLSDRDSYAYVGVQGLEPVQY